MYASSGIGLAAPQINYNISMMILSSEIDRFESASITDAKLELPGGKSCYVLLNVKISRDSDKLVDLFKGEGCLSFPIEVTGKVDRYEEIELEYDNLEGNHNSISVKGQLETVIQHEADHLWGVMFPARMKTKERNLIIAKYCNKHGINYDTIDKFVSIMLQNADRAKTRSQKELAEASEKGINLDPTFQNIEQLKSFCLKNQIDSQQILANIAELTD
jgi:peptide deformylase